MTFDEWWAESYARYPNYDTPLMVELARAAWDKATFAEREREREHKAAVRRWMNCEPEPA